MESIINELSETFKSNNLVLTSQRREIIKAFLQCEKHMTPGDIYKLVRSRDIGFATVYRTIHLLSKLGILVEFAVDRSKLYELKKYGEKSIHVNFKCASCSTIYDLIDDELITGMNKLKEHTKNKFNAEIDDIIIVMNGKCSKCRR